MNLKPKALQEKKYNYLYHDFVAKILFCYCYQLEVTLAQPSLTEIYNFRNKRFLTDEYWVIWKKYGVFFAFLEGFFHTQGGRNELCKVPDSDKDIFKSPKELLNNFPNSTQLASYLTSCGITRMVNNRSRYIINASTRILEEFRGTVPQEASILESFDGYGRKLVNMFLNLAFDKPKIAIDRHVMNAAMCLSLVPNSNYKYPFLEVDNMLHAMYKDSIYLIEMDYLLFSFGKLNAIEKNKILHLINSY